MVLARRPCVGADRLLCVGQASRDIAAGETVLDEEAVGTANCPATHPAAAMAGEQTLAAMELARSIVLEHALDTLAARLAPV